MKDDGKDGVKPSALHGSFWRTVFDPAAVGAMGGVVCGLSVYYETQCLVAAIQVGLLSASLVTAFLCCENGDHRQLQFI